MHRSLTSPTRPAELSACESEPIAIPGAIQPHGVLLAVDEASGRIVNVSANAGALIGRDAAALLNSRVDGLLGDGALAKLIEAADDVRGFGQAYAHNLVVEEVNYPVDIGVHRTDGLLVVEIERSAETGGDGPDVFASAHAAVAKIQGLTDVQELADVVAREVAKISGFERVMIYRFDRDWNGEVIAEARTAEIEPYLGLHYPASDIPAQARDLFRRNVLRLIPDAHYQAVPLVPQSNPMNNRPLDLSMSLLRSVSPIHLEYLENMGVGATLTISLLKHGALWGLIAAHHRTPRNAPFRTRAACELIGRTVSLQITTLEDRADAELRLRLRSLQPALLDAVNREGEFTEAIAVDALLQITGADGAAIKTEGEPKVVGSTPRGRDIRRIIAWLEERDQSDGDQPFATNCLPLENPNFAGIRDTACGLLAIPLTTTKGGWILWFRPEVVRTVTWGGDPRKPMVDDGARISPRKSFEAWKEVVQLHSLPWEGPQIEAAIELRRLLSDVMMRRAREYAKINAELARSNQELESFAYVASHDLKEPLRGIHHYAQFLKTDYGERLDDKGRAMLESVGGLATRMEQQIQSLLSLAQVGSDEAESRDTDANAALDEVIELLRPRLEGFDISRGPLPRVYIAPARLREVLLNLISNAVKYTDKDEKRISVGVTDVKRSAQRPLPATSELPVERMAVFYVADNGIGIPEKHLESIFRMFKRLHAREAYGGGTGAGLAIARKIIEQQGGTMWAESIQGEGTTFYFTVPLARE